MKHIGDGGKPVHDVFKNLSIKGGGGGRSGVMPPPSPPSYGDPRIFKYKDDVIVILLVGISFLGKWTAPEPTISFKTINVNLFFSNLNRK